MGGIGDFSTALEYNAFLDTKFEDKKRFLHDLAEQNHALARICTKKYSNLKPGFFWIVVGVLVGGIGWFFS